MVREKSLFDAFSVTKCQITCCVEAFSLWRRVVGAGGALSVDWQHALVTVRVADREVPSRSALFFYLFLFF